jgi:hypothetical protein
MQKQIISLALRKQVLAIESDIASENVVPRVPVRLYLKSKSFTSSSDL